VITGTRAGGPGLRPAVLWHKGSFGSDSEAGSRFVERLLTVVATCRQQGRPLLDFLVAAGEAVLRGTAAPSLLPTRPGSAQAHAAAEGSPDALRGRRPPGRYRLAGR